MKNVNWMDDLKLRVGYGVTGINVADPYTSLSSLNYNGAFLYNGTWVKALETIRNNNATCVRKKTRIQCRSGSDVLGGRLGGTVAAAIYVNKRCSFGTTRVLFTSYMYQTNASQCIGNGK